MHRLVMLATTPPSLFPIDRHMCRTRATQLGKSQITEPWLRERLLEEGIFEEGDMTPLPTPPEDPIVPPWGGNRPPPPLSNILTENQAIADSKS